MTEPTPVPPEVTAAYWDYRQARSNRIRWEARERKSREMLLLALGYDEDDPKAESVVATTPSGAPLFRIAVKKRRGKTIYEVEGIQ